MERKKKKNKSKSKSNKIYKILFLIIIFYVMTTLYQQRNEMQFLGQQESEYLQEIAKRQQEIADLEEQLAQSENDEYIEKIARQQLKMIGSDEIMIIDIGHQ